MLTDFNPEPFIKQCGSRSCSCHGPTAILWGFGKVIVMLGVLFGVLYVLTLMGCAGGESDPAPVTTPAPQSQPAQPVVPPPTLPAPAPTPPPKPATVMLAFAGTVSLGTVTGTLEYVIAQGPIATDVRGSGSTRPNVVYQLQDYHFIVESGWELLPSGVYAKDAPNNTVEFCEGKCIFATPECTQITFKNGSGYELSLAFFLNDPTPLINPPGSLEEWGPIMLNASRYSVVNNGVPTSTVQSGTLSLPVE